jgi:hypothetical protein
MGLSTWRGGGEKLNHQHESAWFQTFEPTGEELFFWFFKTSRCAAATHRVARTVVPR